jgi:hypothetical protein
MSCSSAARTGAGSFSRDVLGVRHKFRALLDPLLRGKLTGCVTLPGPPETSLPNSMVRRAVVREPEYCAFGDNGPERHARNNAIADGEIFRRGMRAQRKFVLGQESS